jgi:hypothetical protein
MFIAGTRDIQITTAYIIDRLIIDQEGAIRVLNSAVGRKNSIVRFDDSSGDARGRVNGKLELGFLSIVGRETLQEESSKAGPSTASK